MAEKVREVLLRLSAARSGFEALRPLLEPLVRRLDDQQAQAAAQRQRQRRAEEEAQEREAQEAARSWEEIDGFFWEKLQEKPMIFMGKSMVSG